MHNRNLKVRICAICVALLLASVVLPTAAAPVGPQEGTKAPWSLLLETWNGFVDAFTGADRPEGEQVPILDPNGIALTDPLGSAGEQVPIVDSHGNDFTGGAVVDPNDD
jgi:hypothetical protein